MEEIAKVVHHFILHEFLPGEDPGELTEETPLITGGILDSIRTLKLVVFLEDRFGVTVEAHEAGVEHLDSVGQIAALIARRELPRSNRRRWTGHDSGCDQRYECSPHRKLDLQLVVSAQKIDRSRR